MSLMFLEVCSFLSLILWFIAFFVVIGIFTRLGEIRKFLKAIAEKDTGQKV